MRGWLLLVSGGVGVARGVLDISVSDGMPELEVDRLLVGRVTVNGARSGDLATSAQQGSRVALRLLFRELGRNRSLAHLEVATEAPGATVTGRSSELLFGLAVFLHLAHRDRLAVFPVAQFAATGTLDPLGNVGSVEGVAAKISAALASDLPAGGFLFYPRANDDQVSADLHRQCQARGVHLRPVDRIDDALIDLGIAIQGGWPGTPFRSLEPFNHEHARIFFGRQAEVTALAARLDQRAVAGRPGALVIGASGAGKSSFCMAGLLPALAKETPALEHAIWRPRDAIAGKSDTDIGEVDIARSLLASWRRRDENQTGFSFAAALPDSEDLATLVASLPDDALAHHPHVWVVDQFEELFTLGFSAEARIAFANFLRDLQARGVWIIGTLRSEFYGQYLDLRDENGDALLTRVFDDDGVFNLPRMGRDALHQVIIRPAELAGLRFETRATDDIRLDDVVLADALATDDALPLLGFTLQQLYDALERGEHQADPAAEQPRTLTFSAYEALGGLKGAIGKIVEPRFALLDADARAALPGLLSALAVPSGDGLRETARPASIAQWSTGSPGRRLIDELIAIRVLVSEQASTPGSPPQIRVAHEALFSHWDEARRILQESVQDRLSLGRFRDRCAQWLKSDRPSHMLLRSSLELNQAKILLEKGIISKKSEYDTFIYVSSSIDLLKREKSRRRHIVIAVSLSATLIAAFAGETISDVESKGVFEREGNTAASQGLSPAARLFAIAALPNWGATSGGDMTADAAGLRLPVVAEIGKTDLESTAISADGRILVTGSYGPIEVWDAQRGVLLRELAGPGSLEPALSADGRKLLVVGSDFGPNNADIWDTETGERLPTTPALKDVLTGSISPDGSRVAIGPLNVKGTSSRRKDILVDATNGRSIAFLDYDPEISYFYFSRDSSILVTRTGSIWNARKGVRLGDISLPSVESWQVYNANETIFFIGADGRAYISPTRSPSKSYDLTTLKIETGRSSSDGKNAFFVLKDGTTQLWDIQKRAPKAELKLNSNISFGVFSNDSTRILMWPTNGPAGIWDTLDGRRLAVTDGPDTYFGYAGGTRFAIRSKSESGELWDAKSATRLAAIGAPGMASELVLASTGQRLFSRTRADIATLVDSSTVLSGSGGVLRNSVCRISGPRLASFAANVRNGAAAGALVGRPWHPCDWRGLDTREGWRQLARRWLVKMGISADYRCAEVDANGQISSLREAGCRRAELLKRDG